MLADTHTKERCLGGRELVCVCVCVFTDHYNLKCASHSSPSTVCLTVRVVEVSDTHQPP